MGEACDLTARNAVRNGVADRIRVARGDLFESVGGMRFDLVVDDVSGVAEEVAVVSSWFPPQVPLGGSDGTSLAIAMLRQSPQHLRAGGQLFFPVLSLSNGAKIVAVAREDLRGPARTRRFAADPVQPGAEGQPRDPRTPARRGAHHVRADALAPVLVARGLSRHRARVTPAPAGRHGRRRHARARRRGQVGEQTRPDRDRGRAAEEPEVPEPARPDVRGCDHPVLDVEPRKELADARGAARPWRSRRR